MLSSLQDFPGETATAVYHPALTTLTRDRQSPSTANPQVRALTPPLQDIHLLPTAAPTPSSRVDLTGGTELAAARESVRDWLAFQPPDRRGLKRV